MVENRRTSPRHPIIGLEEAVDLAEKVFDGDRQYPVERETAVKHMGFTGMSGWAMRMLASVLQYGLLEKAPDGQVKVTDRTVRILHPEGPSDKAEALSEASHEPDLFAKIYEKFPDGSPSDRNLESFLVRLGFLGSAIQPATKAFRATEEFLARSGSVPGEESEPTQESSGSESEPLSKDDREPEAAEQKVGLPVPFVPKGDRKVVEGTLRHDTFTLEEGTVSVTWPRQLSEDAVDDLQDWFELLLRKMRRAAM